MPSGADFFLVSSISSSADVHMTYGTSRVLTVGLSGSCDVTTN
jgi:hypothetical protein